MTLSARVCFVVPAHGRLELARIILTRLAAVAAELDAGVAVVACDGNLELARELGFHTIRRDNRLLGRRFNDGIEWAAAHADHVIPLGSDDLITPRLVEAMLEQAGHPTTVVATRSMAAVAPTGELAPLRIRYDGGAGPRLYPTSALRTVGCRPADETRSRAIDTSITRRLKQTCALRWAYVDSDPLELVDFKTAGENLNVYERLVPYADGLLRRGEPAWAALARVHPPAVISELRALYP